jgi:hypothetical protein
MTMQSKKLAGPKPGPATQKYLDIAEIREDVVVMRDGTLRAVLLVASINFALKSEDEQQAIIQQYINFMNSLEFPLQIVIQSRKLNIEGYMDRLLEAQKSQKNELLKLQIADYRGFITELVDIGQIMQKQFFVVIPYNPLSDKNKGFWSRLGEAFQPATVVKLADKRFRERREAILQRMGIISNNLGSMGLKSVQLDTQGLIELYYRAYNPELLDSQKLRNVEDLKVTDNQNSV